MPFAETSLNDSVSQRRAKIVATLGPASNTVPVFRDLVRAGIDVVRLNFSHGTHEEKLALIQMIRKVSREEHKPLCILGDLQGPKIRTSKLKDHQPVLLRAGNRLTITTRDVPGTASLVGTTFKTLAENVEQGSRILLSDGLIELRVREVAGHDVVCDVINGGMLGENKGINLPGIPVRVPSLTEKDSQDLEFAIRNGVDAIAVSFVRTAEDVRMVRNRVGALGARRGSLPSWRNRRRSNIWTRFCRWLTGSWWRAATWVWKCRRNRSRLIRSTSSAGPPSIASR